MSTGAMSVEKACGYLSRFFPDLIERLHALGPGKVLKQVYPAYRINAVDHNNVITDIYLAVHYQLDDRGLIKLKVSLRKHQGIFRRYHYGYCYEENGEELFRVDLDRANSYHVHLHKQNHNGDKHIPAHVVQPDATDMDPRSFLGLVSQFRSTGQIPLKVKR